MKTGEHSEAEKRSRPIGVFDSGIGGLTVVSALRKVLPNETIYYLGDTARVPYGGKSAATVERYSLEITEMLLAENCKTIIVACNTPSALALPRLGHSHPGNRCYPARRASRRRRNPQPPYRSDRNARHDQERRL